MRFHKTHLLVVFAAVSTLVGPVAGAWGGTIWQFTHEASGSGSANLFDGGPVVSQADATISLDDSRMSFSARDSTGSGVLGASASAIGISDIVLGSDILTLNADLSTSYRASSRVGAVRPGGEAQAWMTSVVEFVMPVDTLRWGLVFTVDRLPSYTGSASLLVENVTRSEILVDESGSDRVSFRLDTFLSGTTDDLIRVSIDASAAGSTAPGLVSFGGFDVRVQQLFIVPEPASLSLLGLGALLVLRRRRSIHGEPRSGESHDLKEYEDRHRCFGGARRQPVFLIHQPCCSLTLSTTRSRCYQVPGV